MGIAAIALLAGHATFAQTEDDKLHQEANDLFDPIPTMVPSVKGNPVTREKIDLGRMLFSDPRIAASGILSCNSCHNLAMAAATMSRPRSAMDGSGAAAIPPSC